MKTCTIRIISLAFLTYSILIPAAAQDLKPGKRLLETRQINKAHKYFLDQVKNNPQSAEALFYLAETYVDLGNTDSAVANYQRGMLVNKKFLFNEAGLGRLILMKGDTVKAREIFTDAIKSDKKNTDLYAYIAKISVLANQPKIAAWYVTKGKEVSAKNGNIHMAEGDLFALKGNAGEAVNAFERVNDYEKNNALAYVKIGDVFTGARTWSIAEDNYKKALAIDPEYPPAFRGLGEMNYRRGFFQAASENYKKYMNSSETSLDDNYRYAFILFSNKEFAEATKVLEDLLKRDPSNPVLLRLQAYMSYELGVDGEGNPVNPENIRVALDHINRFMEVQAKDKFLSSDFEYLAKIQSASGLKDYAPANFLKAYQMDTTKTDLIELAAKTYVKAEKYDSAAVIYRKLLKVSDANQSYNTIQVGLNYYWAALKDTVKADSLFKMERLVLADSAFKRFTDLSPKSHLGPLYMGRTEREIETLDPGRFGIAAASFQKTIDMITAANEQNKRKNDLYEAYYYFAYLYYQKAFNARVKEKNNALYLETKTKSLEYWNKLLELNPNDPKAQEGIKAVNELAKVQTKPVPVKTNE